MKKKTSAKRAGTRENELVQRALRYHQEGALIQAEHYYRQALDLNPNSHRVLHLLGRVWHEMGHGEKGREYILQAIAINPGVFTYHMNLAAIYQSLGNTDMAEHQLRCAIKLAPKDITLHYNLAVLLKQLGRIEESFRHFTIVLDRQPDDVEAHFEVGCILKDEDNTEDAIVHFKKVIKLRPDHVDAYGCLAEAMGSRGDHAAAIETLNTALAIRPGAPGLLNNLGSLHLHEGRLSAAIDLFKEALERQPDYPAVHSNLALALLRLGRISAAESACRKAMKLQPGSGGFVSNYLYGLHYDPDIEPIEIFNAHRDHAGVFSVDGVPAPAGRVGTKADHGGKIRVGYVSADFRMHSVASYIKPVLERHNHDLFSIYGYYNKSSSDRVTERLKQLFDVWRTVARFSDEELFAQVQRDEIDILIDLSGHTAGHRLRLFTMRPAPVQVTWLGYPDTTGLAEMDYRLTDKVCDPVGVTEQFHTEQLWRLPGVFSCFEADKKSPDVVASPVFTNDYVTFGSFNNFAKINDEVIRVWSGILARVNDSCLLIKSEDMNNPDVQDEIRGGFERHGVKGNQLKFLGSDVSKEDHLRHYGDIDIALDPFPYNGTTTTCDALWMGVPVVCVQGATYVGRVGASQLGSLGLADLVAHNKDEYIAIAVNLATNHKRLRQLRSSLREIMGQSLLTDAVRFTGNLEAAFRAMIDIHSGKAADNQE